VAATLEIDGGGAVRSTGNGEGEERIAQRLSPRYSWAHLIAGAPHVWFAGGIVVPGEPNRRCAGNKVGPAILRT
jgi:hypothetical protein